MQPQSKTIVFFGNERLATGVTTSAPTLRGLIAAGYRVASVVIKQNGSNQSTDTEVVRIAQEHSIPLLMPSRLVDIVDDLRALKADIGILAAFGRIISQEILDVFPFGIINLHPSELPRGRGSTPVESAILDGLSSTAVSVMQLVKAMDAGPVFAQTIVQLTGHETKQQLADKLSLVGSEMILAQLPAILSGTALPKDQDESEATYNSPITKDEGIIVWQKPSAQIEREIRAYADWPKSRTMFGDIDVVITASKVVNRQGLKPGEIAIEGQDLIVGCGENTALSITQLKPAGKKEMPALSFLAGYRNRISVSN